MTDETTVRPNASRRRIFAGSRLRALRDARALRQVDMAKKLSISVSYLSQLENDDRPLTPALLEVLARDFPLDWQEFEEDAATRRFAALREAAADPLFTTPLPADQLARIAEQQPTLAEQFVKLHAAYRNAGQRLQIIDEALGADNAGGSRLPWEEVRDWFHNAGNYVDDLDRAAERLGDTLRGTQPSPPQVALELYLRNALSVSLVYAPGLGLRDYDPQMGHLLIDQGLPADSQRFQ